ncbi:beta-N-acetylhexosaminidase [Streptomyces sp. NBC_00190]|uniref:beta-N-acetylhexosaminidase n=1 Tax=unclassified Streptomyces TaxID=2593676 RepID=UPI002E28FF4A|nr:beta-N-acetylhexosaminidase [Streptomyces sp. NBC_00190]WSZ38760.1 beta-N-acetylhexosaminidase [Streptomyces sp. NBC_00868]
MKLPVAFGALGGLLLCAAVAASSAPAGHLLGSAAPVRRTAPAPYQRIVPAPAAVAPGGPGYTLGPRTVIRTTAGSGEVRAIGEQLAAAWRRTARLPLPVQETAAEAVTDGIRLRLDPYAGSFGEEGYRLQSDEDGVIVTAFRPAGLFRGTQTLRQLLPVGGAPWTVAGGAVTDTPRFAHRAATVEAVRPEGGGVARLKAYVDQLALYKINVLRTRGAWTADAYRELVRHARGRYMEVVPEPRRAEGSAVVMYARHEGASPAERAKLAQAVRAGARVILSPADRALSVRRAYEWDPGDCLPGVPRQAVLGVAAPPEYEQFQRVLGVAELGWSPAAALDWDAYRERLAAQGPRLDAMGVRYSRTPEVPWP